MNIKLQNPEQNIAPNDLLYRLLKLLPRNLYLNALFKVMTEQFGIEKLKPTDAKSFEQELKIPGSPAQKKVVNELIAVYIAQIIAYSVKQINLFQFMLEAIFAKILLSKEQKATVSKASKVESDDEILIQKKFSHQHEELKQLEQRLKELDAELQKNKKEYEKLFEVFDQEESKLSESYLLEIDECKKAHQENLQNLLKQKEKSAQVLETNYVKDVKELTVEEESKTTELIKQQKIERENIENLHKTAIDGLTEKHVDAVMNVKQHYSNQIILLGERLVGNRPLEVVEKQVLLEMVVLLSQAKNFMEEINILGFAREKLGLEPGLTSAMANFNKLLKAEAGVIKKIDASYALKKEALKDAYTDEKAQLEASFETDKEKLYQEYQHKLKLLGDKNTNALSDLKSYYKSREHELCEKYEHNLQVAEQKYNEEQQMLFIKKESAVSEVLVKIIEVESQMQQLVKNGINLYQKAQQNFTDQKQDEITDTQNNKYATPFNIKLKPMAD